ncbi:Folate-biopterin transporter 1, chloroplastic, partial [Mucuna pruriens]
LNWFFCPLIAIIPSRRTIAIGPCRDSCEFWLFCIAWLVKPLYEFISDSKVISSVLSRLIGVLSWSLMDTFVDNKYNRGHTVSHKAPQDIFRGCLTFGGIVRSYFSGSLMDTYGVGFIQIQTLLLEEPLELFLLANFSDSELEFDLDFLLGLNSLSIFLTTSSRSEISSIFQIISVTPQRTRRDVPNAMLQHFSHLLPLEPLVFLVGQTLQLLVGLGIGAMPIAAVTVQICTIFFATEFLWQSAIVQSSICVPRVSVFGGF